MSFTKGFRDELRHVGTATFAGPALVELLDWADAIESKLAARPVCSMTPERIAEIRTFLDEPPGFVNGQDVRIKRLRHVLEECLEAIAARPDLEAIAGQAKRIRKLEGHALEMKAAFMRYIQWHGACHQAGCPCDDTCDCKGKPVNDWVDGVIRKALP